jgi:hypothetical protein
MEDQDLPIPRSFTAPIAARLLKTTGHLLRQLTAAGGIKAEGKEHRRYRREELERLLGRRLTLADWLEAEAAQQPRRQANTRYNAKRSMADTGLGLTKGAA